MAILAKFLFASATLFALVSAYDAPKCYKEGERCIGARGFPEVEYHPCCDGMECTAKDTSYGGYGFLCAKKGYVAPTTYEAPKCYKEGERCIGAPGFPSVKYYPCCEGFECSAKDTSYGGYGLVCAKKGYVAPKYEEPKYEEPKYEAPKCYKEGERCLGAPGFPAVKYHPCCGDMKCSAKDTSYGGYGFVCAKKTYVPPQPKCVAEGEQCKKGGLKCCGYNKCVKGYGKYEYVCGLEKTLPPTTTAPKCVPAGEECKKGGLKCCGYKKCVPAYGKYGKYEFVCGDMATTQPPTTTPKCLAAGEKCGGYGYDACCPKTECKSTKVGYTYEKICVKKDY